MKYKESGDAKIYACFFSQMRTKYKKGLLRLFVRTKNYTSYCLVGKRGKVYNLKFPCVSPKGIEGSKMLRQNCDIMLRDCNKKTNKNSH